MFKRSMPKGVTWVIIFDFCLCASPCKISLRYFERLQKWRVYWIPDNGRRSPCCILPEVVSLFGMTFCTSAKFAANISNRCLNIEFILILNDMLSQYRPSVVCRLFVCPSVVCNARAPYLAGWNFRQWFYAMWYLSHRWHPRKILRRSS